MHINFGQSQLLACSGLMIMGRLTITWRCSLLMILLLYIHPQVDSALSDQTHFNSSSPDSTELSHQKECSALLQFKNSTYKSSPQCLPCNGSETTAHLPCFKTDSWMEGEDCCSWDWVLCDPIEAGHVIHLYLDDSCLKGTLNLSIFLQLPRLQRIKLKRNSLTGLIPAPLSELEDLYDIDLSGNMLSGQIPDIFSNLRGLYYLDLSRNHFTGPVPRSLCDGLPNLTELSLSYNFLNGGVPSCLFNMPSLSRIRLENNQLSGPTGQFKRNSSVLEDFFFGSNRINGPVPSSIFELLNLTYLDLSSNNLTGTLKFDMLPKLRRLESLVLSGNSLLSFSFDDNVNEKEISSFALKELSLSSCNISEFPSFLSSLENLESLDLSHNRIHGQIFKHGSEGWPSLKELNLSHNFLTYVEHPWKNINYLFLDNNKLQGSLLVPPPETRYFLVSNNNFTGYIPPSFCNLSLINALDLSGNNLDGKIPKCFENLIIGLNFLHLQNNILQGSIPDIFANASTLASLDLSGNNLEGSLPRSLSSCEELEVINVGNNKISDTFPDWLETLPNLKILVLKSNQFYGTVFDSNTSFSTLRILDISSNKFIGHLSIKPFENLKGMMSTGESENIYMGSECSSPSVYDCKFFDSYRYSLSLIMKGKSIEFERIFKDLRVIDLSNNYFEGSIPEILGKFKPLTMLNLSHNSLTGKIPSSFGNMTALQSLDLSSNKLDGRIPEQMKSLTFLALLNLSHNSLSGPIPQGGQFSTYESDSFIGNKGLCGMPLPDKCNNDLAPSIAPPFLQEEDDAAEEFSWKIAMMGYGCGLIIGLSIGYFVISTRKLQWLERIIEGRLHKKFLM